MWILKVENLAVSTMSLNSKMKIVSIKEDLKKTNENESRSIKSVISTINKKYFQGRYLECL
jgi:hypothetical protein